MTEKRLFVALFAFMFCLLIGITWAANVYRNDLRKANNLNAQYGELLNNVSFGVEGKSCGILSESVAEDLLGVDAVVKDIGSRQGAFAIEGTASNVTKLYWSDVCLYESYNDSQKYVGLFLLTYDNKEEAGEGFIDVLPKVGDGEILFFDDKNPDETIVYNSGVVYWLKDNRIYQVSGSNGVPRETKQFVIDIFESLRTNF